MGVIHHCALRWLIMGYSVRYLLGYLMVSNELVGNLMGTYAPVIKHSLLEVPPFSSMTFPARSLIYYRGFPIATFDCRRVTI